MQNPVRRLELEPESWREELLRAILGGLAEGIGAACLLTGLALALWGWP